MKRLSVLYFQTIGSDLIQTQVTMQEAPTPCFFLFDLKKSFIDLVLVSNVGPLVPLNLTMEEKNVYNVWNDKMLRLFVSPPDNPQHIASCQAKLLLAWDPQLLAALLPVMITFLCTGTVVLPIAADGHSDICIWGSWGSVFSARTTLVNWIKT